MGFVMVTVLEFTVCVFPLTVRFGTDNVSLLGLYLRFPCVKEALEPVVASTNVTKWSAFAEPSATVVVAALPSMLPVIVLENVLVPAIVSFPVFITAPAAATFVASVTSAFSSIAANLVRSAPVIIAPEPTLVTSDRAVTLLVV